MGDVYVQVFKFVDDDYQDNIHIISIEFKKAEFNLRKSLDWLNIYNISVAYPEDDGNYIYNANKVIEGIKFKNIPLILYEKGKERIRCNDNYIEVTEKYKAYKKLIDSRQSKEIHLDKTKDGKQIIYSGKKNFYAKIIYNDIPIDYIPVLHFEKSKDIVICNGNVILCDYIAPYKDVSLGFYQGIYRPEIESIPISFLLDMDTTIYITVEMKLDGSKFCVITYNYIID